MTPQTQQMIQHKAEIATTAAASSAAITWIEQANAYIDMAAGIIAVISGCLAIAWYIRRFRHEHKGKSNGSNANSQHGSDS